MKQDKSLSETWINSTSYSKLPDDCSRGRWVQWHGTKWRWEQEWKDEMLKKKKNSPHHLCLILIKCKKNGISFHLRSLTQLLTIQTKPYVQLFVVHFIFTLCDSLWIKNISLTSQGNCEMHSKREQVKKWCERKKKSHSSLALKWILCNMKWKSSLVK